MMNGSLLLSISAEIGELIAYIALLKGTLYDNGQSSNDFINRFGILIYAVPVCIVQVILLLVGFFIRQRKASQIDHLTRKDEQNISLKTRLKNFVIDIILFIFSNSLPILLLFVGDESRFRNFLAD